MLLPYRSAGNISWRATAFLGLMCGVSFLFADDTNAPSATAPPPFLSTQPQLTTNAAASPFLESHPELAQPAKLDQAQTALSPSESAPTNRTPEVVPSEEGPAPESLSFSNSAGQAEELPDHLLVVYNQDDPDSKPLADYYAERRNIPPERVLAISCPSSEEITRAEYDDTIREPITTYLLQKGWMTRESAQTKVGDRMMNLLIATHNDIWAIALIRGVPLKIAPDPSDVSSMGVAPQWQTNAAAVDSELALLPLFGLPKGGYVPNIFFDSKANGFARVGPELATRIILVTRLDGPSPDDVRRMIDDSIYAERNRLAGLAVVDSRGLTDVTNGYTVGDIWLRAARDMLVRDGWTVKFDDKPELLPATDPCNQVALYLGWYSSDAQGPWVTPPTRFVRGAIAYHLHSFSAVTVRSRTVGWAGPLIAHGATATMGTVYEPYLELTPHEDIFTKRILDGDYFAEAAYASQPGLSWMGTVIGDPLYRPFRKPLESALASAEIPHTDHDDWLFLQQVRRQLVAGQIAATPEAIKDSLDLPGTGAIVHEVLGDILQKLNDPEAGPAAEEAYKKALDTETAPIDRIRVGLKLAQYYSNHGLDGKSQGELDVMRDLYPTEAKRFGVPDPLVPTSVPATNTFTSQPLTTPTQAPVLPTLPAPPQPPKPSSSNLPPLPQQKPGEN